MVQERVIAVVGNVLRAGVDVHRCAAAQALGNIAAPSCLDALCGALLDEDEDVRVDAAIALGKIADPASADALMQNLLGDPCQDVKIAAMDALIKMRHKPVVQWLARLVVGRDEEIAWDEQEYYETGWDDWLDIQMLAIKGLGLFGVEQAVPEIVAALNDEMGQDISEVAFAALIRLGLPGAQALEQVLVQDDKRLRRRVAAMIFTAENPQADRLIALCLKDRDADVRLAAARGLVVANPTDERLIALFNDDDDGVRAQVIRQAGHMFPKLVEQSLDDVAPPVVLAALDIISDHAGAFDAGLADKIKDMIQGDATSAGHASTAWAALAGKGSLDLLGRYITNPEQPVVFRRKLIDALLKLGNTAVPVLVQVAGDNNRQLRLDALNALGRLATEDTAWPNPAAEVLRTALRGELVMPDTDYKQIASDTQPDDGKSEPAPGDEPKEIHDSEPLEATEVSEQVPQSTLQAIISSQSEAQEANAAYVGPQLELSEEEQRLVEMTKNRTSGTKKMSTNVKPPSHLDVPRYAACVIGDIAHDDIAVDLLSVLDSDDAELRSSALVGIAQIGEALGGLPKSSITALEHILNGKDQAERASALRVLGLTGKKSAIDIARQCLGDDNAFIRLEAVQALNALGGVDEAVFKKITDQNTGVRMAVAKAMATMGGSNMVEPLVKFAFANQGLYRIEASRLLRNFSKQTAADCFLRVLEDEDQKRVWQIAIEALGELFAFVEPEERKAAA